MVSFLKNNLMILVIILILGSYLGIKAFDENGWDGWGFGSAQTLMSSKYWAKDGFAENYFLFIAQPYGKLIKYFDEPEFRNRPVETISGVLTLQRDRRLYYTHYPPLYLLPYALIAKTGAEARSIYRIFSLLVSLTGLIFFYLFIKLIANKSAAIIASIYYGFSITFLNYADSISVQPWDILLIFLILYLSVLAWHNFDNTKKYQKYNWAIWFAYLALSLSSYDATFYIFAYLVLFDILILKKFLWRRFLFFAAAPVLGFALQVIQNTWYLGFNDMISDFSRVYANRTFRGVKNFIAGLIMPFHSMASIQTVFIFKKTIVALTSAIAIFGILWRFRERISLNSDYFKIVFILAAAAVVQPFFINATGGWPFQGILTAAFWGLLIGASSVFIFNKRLFCLPAKALAQAGALTVIILMLWSVQLYSTLNYIKDWPNNHPDQKVIEFSEEIKKIYPNEEKMAFRIIPQNQIWKSQFATFNMEYYFGMTKVDFVKVDELLTDFWWLRNISEYPFYSFIVAENKADALKIREELAAKNLKNISPITEIQGQYLFTVGPK